MFVAEVQESIRPILSAYLQVPFVLVSVGNPISWNQFVSSQGDLAYLSANCRREVVERCNAEKRALEAQGLVQLSKVLQELNLHYQH